VWGVSPTIIRGRGGGGGGVNKERGISENPKRRWIVTEAERKL